MSTARFFSRVQDSISPLIGAHRDVGEVLQSRVVQLRATDSIVDSPTQMAGFSLACNLAARLYPAISVMGPSPLVAECEGLIRRINPSCDLTAGGSREVYSLDWSCGSPSMDNVTVGCEGWSVLVDCATPSLPTSTNILTALAAACIGMSELFRTVFADLLPRGRTAPKPGRFDLMADPDCPPIPARVDLGRVHLVGAGAIGQALVYCLARLNAAGTLVVADSETIALSNLQRYVLSMDDDEGVHKTAIVERALRASGIELEVIPTKWEDYGRSALAENVCVAVDSEATRIAVQALLPKRIYNAWTQPADIGWSRHEAFGGDPCLACLYWPTATRPSLHELISQSIKQHPLRVLAYLTHRLTVDQILKVEQIPRIDSVPMPDDVAPWLERSILSDTIVDLQLPGSQEKVWEGKSLGDLYREGVCGGALIGRPSDVIPRDMAVPLAHQSVLAGVMLAVTFVASVIPALRDSRSSITESRFDVLAGLTQHTERPRARTPNCICSDQDFVDRYHQKWA